VSYSIVLICLEFIYGLQLTKNEMPDYEEIGLVRHNVPFFDLLKKVIILKNYTVKLSNSNAYMEFGTESTVFMIWFDRIELATCQNKPLDSMDFNA
jgi:hypothetical protein